MATSFDRTATLESIDPEVAWAPWEPSEAEPWDERRAAHLFRRAGFGASDKDLKRAVAMTPEALIDSLFSSSGDPSSVDPSEFEAESKTLADAILAAREPQSLSSWWLHRMLNSPEPLREKMTMFWHGHFATGAEKVLDAELMFNQNQLLREHALGDFRLLVHRIAKDPSMLIYLDSATNRKAHANENFARELMELFCLGEGNYSEEDVQQLARCFTGWEIRRKQFRFNSYQHDDGLKTLLGKEGIESGEQAIDQVLSQRTLPEFVVSKMIRFFVCDEPVPNQKFLQPLTDQLSRDSLNVAEVTRKILNSRLLLSDWCFGRKVRSPVEMAVGFLKTLQASANLSQLGQRLKEVGHGLFYPPNVKGWDGGRAWINSSTLVGRANLIFNLLHDENTRFGGNDLLTFSGSRGEDALQFFHWFEKSYFVNKLTAPQITSLTSQLSLQTDKLKPRAVLALAAALPQFHLA